MDKARAYELINELAGVINKYIHVMPERRKLFEDLSELRKMIADEPDRTGTGTDRNTNKTDNT